MCDAQSHPRLSAIMIVGAFVLPLVIFERDGRVGDTQSADPSMIWRRGLAAQV